MTRYKKQDPELTRRKFINAAMGGAAAVGTISLVSALGSAKPALRLTADKAPPRKGDVLVHAEAAKEGQPIRPSEVTERGVPAWPMSADGVIRKGEPNNQLAVYRFERSRFQEPAEQEPRVVLKLDGITADGVIAYSNKCTHAGCPVPNDEKDLSKLFCGCHSGQYDLLQGCKKIGGPPPRSMPQLPITLENDRLVVTETFVTAPFGFLNEQDWETYLQQVEEILG
ncbi:Rieske 2Fe-2S domain-containing protein [Deinococcus sp. HMF7620]|uniref:Rieske 2Fe-2S domain-containing protein n=1 Tax=Deinococcus arboris TaxID=2682977 RepID=A0A7C9M4Q6_9DEIO|nr:MULTISPECIES: Rieske 2Fe-2S domain-containing protein [Deinococcus]MBZ9750902.1 Rieske 2Fe-2S domain-containing protein [Deinococcus betulae]MVN89242.1 Rieske 2Fe-2S domain-containing protein [Deinococcus arboris]